MILAEDSRAQGFIEPLGTAGVPAFELREGLVRRFGWKHDSFPLVGLYFAFREYGYEDLIPDCRSLVASVDPTAVDDVLDLVDRERRDDWRADDRLGTVVDRAYEDGMRPLLKSALAPLTGPTSQLSM